MEERIDVQGMGCQACADRVQEALLSLKGVERVEVDLERGQAVLAFDPQKQEREDLIRAIQKAGYEA